jgi:3-ketosteroid 9alpha-monooxygenase subunit A
VNVTAMSRSEATRAEPGRLKHLAWCQIAFEQDLVAELTPVTVGPKRFVVARTSGGIRAFDADCPHRGAHLGVGGQLENERIVCPFHGYKIGLGCQGDLGFRVREYRTLVVGGLVFILLSESMECGLTEYLLELDRTHYIVPGFSMEVCVDADMVTENGFDLSHFGPVHNIGTHPQLVVRTGSHGELLADGVFKLPWDVGPGAAPHSGPVHAEYHARAYGPWLVISEVRTSLPYTIITAATPTAKGQCVVRLSLVVSANGGTPTTEWCQATLRNSRHGLELDRAVWDNLSPHAGPERLTAQDAPVLAFREFCKRFGAERANGHSQQVP